MTAMKELFQSADWKSEKHVPVIDAPDSVKAGEFFDVTVTLGKAIAHPNTTEHHIRWITLFYKPDGAKLPFQVGRFDFTAHGESTDGPNKGPVYTNHSAQASLKIDKSGELIAAAYCNIHGMWESSKPIKVG
jgi:superoxide reductase